MVNIILTFAVGLVAGFTLLYILFKGKKKGNSDIKIGSIKKLLVMVHMSHISKS